MLGWVGHFTVFQVPGLPMMKCRHHAVVLKVLLYGAAHNHLIKKKDNKTVEKPWAFWLSAISHLLVIDPLAVDEVLVLARRVVLVLDLPLADGDMTEAAPAERDPAPRAVLPHHHLGPHPHQVVPAAISNITSQYTQYLLTLRFTM